MKLLLVLLIVCILQTNESRKLKKKKDIHHRHTHVDGAAIGPAKVRVYEDVPLRSPPGSIEHETQYWHETNQVK